MDLFFIPMVAVAISLVICWSLYSLHCSFIHEAISLIMAERGRFMRKYLLRQFYDQPNGFNWASMLYMHGTVELLTRDVSKPTNEIDGQIFAKTLIEVVGKAHITQINKPLVAHHLYYKSELINDFKAATLSLQQSDQVGFYQQSLNTAELCMHPDGTPDEHAIYKNLVEQIENWYNQLIDRLSLWYKKRTRLRLFILGTVLAILLNVDSIQLVQHFTSNPASRQVIMDYYEANEDRLNELVKNSQNPVETSAFETQVRSYGEQMDSLAYAAEIPVGWKQNLFNSSTWKSEKEKKFGTQRSSFDAGKGLSQVWQSISQTVKIFFWGIFFS